MTHPHSLDELLDRCGLLQVAANHWIAEDTGEMVIHGVLFRRRFNSHPTRRGGGYVAASAYVPDNVTVPWNTVVFPYMYVFENADFAGAPNNIAAKTYRVARDMTELERYRADRDAGMALDEFLMGRVNRDSKSHVTQ